MRGLSVIIPSKTASNLGPCLESLWRNENSAFPVIVDDGIAWEAVNFTGYALLKVPGEKPFIFARNINIGIRAAGDDDVVLLNDDALLQTPGGFTAMQRAAEECPEYGIISSTTNVSGNPDQFRQNVGLRDAGAKSVAFVCVLIPRRTIEAVGLLDERFTAYGWEDNDYCRRVRGAGLRVGIFDGCFVDHGSLKSTFRGEPGAAGNIYAGRDIYLQKWGDLA